MEELDNMFNNMSITYSCMDVSDEVKEINNNYLSEMCNNIQNIKLTEDIDMKHLHIIAKKGYYDICKNYIIGNNVNIRTTNTNRIPLHYACMNNHIKIAELLIDHRSEINVQDIYGFYPINYAVMNNYLEMVNLLICCGSDIESSLYYAVNYRLYDIVKEILEYNIEYIFLENASYYAYNIKDTYLIELINSYINKH
jgi:ankyrin repeat protein